MVTKNNEHSKQKKSKGYVKLKVKERRKEILYYQLGQKNFRKLTSPYI